MPKTKKETREGSFTQTLLNDEQKKLFTHATERITQLQSVRQKHFSVNLDQLWADADRDYVPHRLGATKSKRLVEVDDEKGWRGSRIVLGESNWQSDISQANAYIKIQIALSILIDQNPSGVFTATSKKYQAATELIRQLYKRSWDHAKSKEQLKLFVFNLAKYGWSVARTFPLRVARKSKVIKELNVEEPDKSVYEEKEVVEFNDIMRENLDPRNVWIDDMARPNNPSSVKDWCWRKVYDFDVAEEEFGKYKFWKYVSRGGVTTETVGVNAKEQNQDIKNTNLVEIYFYENRIKDVFMVIANGVPIVIEPLPVSDNRGLKKLSLWQTYWTLRHAESPYGIGLYEAIRYDQGMLDRIRNMTLDQLTLSIYKMFFFQGTQALTETGDIRIAPGVGKQVLDPKNINWLDVPGPGKDAFTGIQMIREDLDEVSGVTNPLMGVIEGKTAFETAQAKESALKRLKGPLENILDALNHEGYITVALIQLLYSIPEVYEITDPNLQEDYMKEIEADPELYEREPIVDEETGIQVVNPDGTPANRFKAKVFPEFQLNLDEDEEGNLIETNEAQFFRIKPKSLSWEGVINIKAQSLLTPSKQVDRALNIEMYNILTPMMQQIEMERQQAVMMGMPWAIDNSTLGKVAKDIIELYDKDYRDIFPDSWLRETSAPLFLPMQPMGLPAAQPLGDAPTLTSSPTMPSNPTSFASKVSNKISSPGRAF